MDDKNKFVGDSKVIFEKNVSPSKLFLSGSWIEGFLVAWVYCEGESEYCENEGNSVYAQRLDELGEF